MYFFSWCSSSVKSVVEPSTVDCSNAELMERLTSVHVSLCNRFTNNQCTDTLNDKCYNNMGIFERTVDSVLEIIPEGSLDKVISSTNEDIETKEIISETVSEIINQIDIEETNTLVNKAIEKLNEITNNDENHDNKI